MKFFVCLFFVSKCFRLSVLTSTMKLCCFSKCRALFRIMLLKYTRHSLKKKHVWLEAYVSLTPAPFSIDGVWFQMCKLPAHTGSDVPPYHQKALELSADDNYFKISIGLTTKQLSSLHPGQGFWIMSTYGFFSEDYCSLNNRFLECS